MLQKRAVEGDVTDGCYCLKYLTQSVIDNVTYVSEGYLFVCIKTKFDAPFEKGFDTLFSQEIIS
jgi:hypothetical protein